MKGLGMLFRSTRRSRDRKPDRWLRILSGLSPESIAKLERQLTELGMPLQSKPEPERTSPPPCQPDAKARAVVSEGESLASAERAKALSNGMDFNDVITRLRALGANV
jgi:hypothetical protein